MGYDSVYMNNALETDQCHARKYTNIVLNNKQRAYCFVVSSVSQKCGPEMNINGKVPLGLQDIK